MEGSEKHKSVLLPGENRKRVIIENVKPEIDGGRFPIRRSIGERVVVTADVFADGQEELSAVLKWKYERETDWTEVPLQSLVNDRWQAEFTVTELGRYRYTLEAWIDPFKSWRRDLEKKSAAGQVGETDLRIGVEILKIVATRASSEHASQLSKWNQQLLSTTLGLEARVELALSDELVALCAAFPDRQLATTYPIELEVVVDPVLVRFSTWYEMFPRSCSSEPGRHGTFHDCEERLPYLSEMGFDVLYLPPVHPIGRTKRRGKNNTAGCTPEDVGSPWAIGGEEGGHKAVHPQLGTLKDFQRLVARAREYGIEVALDIAFQCSPDHPYVSEHPEWFRWRPDGKIQYAENPPKKYEDIYPLYFDNPGWLDLWQELKSVVEFWIKQDVRIFRVDNPHTKPFRFWEWLIGEIKAAHPDVIFLSEAFTRPKVMYHLAKIGFTQSYTYFAWRNTRWELEQYLSELTHTDLKEYFRPNFWPNTPDILMEFLQTGGRPAFMIRLVLAATLSASYGIYGPVFEFCVNEPKEPGSEEYLDSEKYEIRHWDLNQSGSLKEFIAKVNRIRRENDVLQTNENLEFHRVDNEQLICYSKGSRDSSRIILVVVDLDPHHTQSGWVELPLDEFGLDPAQPYQVHDLLSNARYVWSGPRNYVELNPHVVPAHIFQVYRRLRTEQDFEYFL